MRGNTDKVMFVNPKQVTQLRKTVTFFLPISTLIRLLMSGEIEDLANTEIAPTRKVRS